MDRQMAVRESFSSLTSEIEVDYFNYKTSCDGWFGCDIELYLWPHFGIGIRSVWLHFSTL